MKDKIIQFTVNLFVLVGCGAMIYSLINVLGGIINGGK